MKTLTRTCFFSLLFGLFLMVSGAFAADLTTAKSQGWIGEQNDGYLGVVKSNAPADVKALVADVNRQRKAQFSQIATKNGISESEAAKVFAREAASRTAAGNYVQNPAGAWLRK